MPKNKFEKKLTARVAGKAQNWYLRGWEYQERTGDNGKSRRTLVYTREYYKISAGEKERRCAKLAAVLIYLALCGVYVWFETTMSQGGLVWYAGAPCLLAIIPIFYLGLGVYNFAATEEYFTYRRMYAAYTRLRVGGKLTAMLLGIGTMGQLVFLLRYGSALALGPELIMLFGALWCAVCAAVLVLLQKNIGCEEVSQKEYPGNAVGKEE